MLDAGIPPLAMMWFLALLAGLLSVSADTPDNYAGDESCRPCHARRFESYRRTGMSRSMVVPDSRDALGDFSSRAEFFSQEAERHYYVFSEGGRYFHREVELDPGGREIYSDTRQILYAIGSGRLERDYLIAEGDRLYMSPLSYNGLEKKWNLSPWFRAKSYPGFTGPVGEGCVACHAGRVRAQRGSANAFGAPPFPALAIGCERCHGPGQAHGDFARRGQVGRSLEVITNPKKLSPAAADGICEQCHLRGDARVNRPGRTLSDFKPGELLSSVVKIFSAPVTFQGERFPGTDYAAQIHNSRCRIGSKGRMTCMACHSPHSEPTEVERSTYFRQRCRECHTSDSCREKLVARETTRPPDNCVACHMPRVAGRSAPHMVSTDHRIRRSPEKSPYPPKPLLDSPETELVDETGETGKEIDRRTKALAFSQLANVRKAFRGEGFGLLAEAAREYPDDLDVQESFALIQLVAAQDTEARQRAIEAMERAVALGSQSGTIYLRLGQYYFTRKDRAKASELLEKALEVEPHLSQAALSLAALYAEAGQMEKARAVAERGLKYDPGKQMLRNLLAKLR